jgi:sirohydrochlorin cobaltochelatase
VNSAVILVGHGAVASDMPRSLVQRLRALEHDRRMAGGVASTEQVALEQQIRNWPRSAATDPYKAGMDAIAERLRQRVSRVEVAFNEFCAPSLESAVESLVGTGVTQIVVISAMITPGGSHAEKDIPHTIQTMRDRYPGIEIRYAWPLDLDAIARLFEDTFNSAVANQ